MNRVHPFKVAIALLHLALVVCGAAGGYGLFAGLGPFTSGVFLYGALSGSSNGYGFFAPGINSQVGAAFLLEDADGNTWTDELQRGHGREAVLRINSGVSWAGQEELRDELARSWAATMFGRHPTATEVVVQVRIYEPPTMEQYHDGVRAEWEVIHEAVFSRE